RVWVNNPTKSDVAKNPMKRASSGGDPGLKPLRGGTMKLAARTEDHNAATNAGPNPPSTATKITAGQKKMKTRFLMYSANTIVAIHATIGMRSAKLYATSGASVSMGATLRIATGGVRLLRGDWTSSDGTSCGAVTVLTRSFNSLAHSARRREPAASECSPINSSRTV